MRRQTGVVSNGAMVHAWCNGTGFADMREHTTSPSGDLVRVLRLTVQLLRRTAATKATKAGWTPVLSRPTAAAPAGINRVRLAYINDQELEVLAVANLHVFQPTG